MDIKSDTLYPGHQSVFVALLYRVFIDKESSMTASIQSPFVIVTQVCIFFKGKHILAQEHDVSRDWTLFIEILFKAAHNQHVEWKKGSIDRHLSYCWISVREVSGQNVKLHVLQTAFKYSIFQSECTDSFSGHGVFNPCVILGSWPFTLTTLTSHTYPTMHHKQRRNECLVFVQFFLCMLCILFVLCVQVFMSFISL